MFVRSSAVLPLAMLALAAALPAIAQQRPDEDYRPQLSHPAYPASGPTVAIDGAHSNFHTMQGGYAPFARLASADGYQVRSLDRAIEADSLQGIDVLVIANARSGKAAAPAFSAGEIAALKRWVEGGGSLLLIADHAPFGTQAAPIAAAFGIPMGLGYVVARDGRRVSSQITFTGDRLGTHMILSGRGGHDKIRRVVSFTGQVAGRAGGRDSAADPSSRGPGSRKLGPSPDSHPGRQGAGARRRRQGSVDSHDHRQRPACRAWGSRDAHRANYPHGPRWAGHGG